MPEPIMHIPAVVKRDDAFNNGGQTQVGKNAAKSAEELEAEAARRKQREADRKDREAKRANAKRCFCLPPKKKKAEGKGRQQMRFPLVCKRWTMFGMLAWCVMLSWLVLVYGLKFEKDARDAEDAYNAEMVVFHTFLADLTSALNITLDDPQ